MIVGVKAIAWLARVLVVCHAATAGPKFVRSGNGQPLIAPRRLLLVLFQRSRLFSYSKT